MHGMTTKDDDGEMTARFLNFLVGCGGHDAFTLFTVLAFGVPYPSILPSIHLLPHYL
jgi:hypothetical protein